MPFKSKAQVRKFYELHKQGKLGSETIAKWAGETKDLKKLPEHVTDSKKPEKKARS